MRIFKRVSAAGLAVAAATAVACAAMPAQAATSTGWRQIISRHYGPAANFSSFQAVVATGLNNAWAFGGTDDSFGAGTTHVPVIVHWNGTTWTTSGQPAGLSSYIIAASAPAANDVWAVTATDGWVLHYNGAKWAVAKRLPGCCQATGIVALSATNVWVLGGSGSDRGYGTWHYDGHAWKQWNTGDPLGLEFGSALSARDIWAIGGTKAPQSTVKRFDGTSWKPVSTKGLPAGQLMLSGIRAFSDTNVWVNAGLFANGASHFFLLHYNGSAWSRSTPPWNLSLGTPVPDSHGGLWMPGIAISSTPASYVVRRTAAGQWLRTTIGTGLVPRAAIGSVTAIPGTASVWGAGVSPAKSGGGSGVIWAYGRI